MLVAGKIIWFLNVFYMYKLENTIINSIINNKGDKSVIIHEDQMEPAKLPECIIPTYIIFCYNCV